MRLLTAPLLVALGLAVPATAQDVKEPASGVTFAPKVGEMSLLGVGLRTKTFLKVKVYAVGFYVADSALAGPLAALLIVVVGIFPVIRMVRHADEAVAAGLAPARLQLA